MVVIVQKIFEFWNCWQVCTKFSRGLTQICWWTVAVTKSASKKIRTKTARNGSSVVQAEVDFQLENVKLTGDSCQERYHIWKVRNYREFWQTGRWYGGRGDERCDSSRMPEKMFPETVSIQNLNFGGKISRCFHVEFWCEISKRYTYVLLKCGFNLTYVTNVSWHVKLTPVRGCVAWAYNSCEKSDCWLKSADTATSSGNGCRQSGVITANRPKKTKTETYIATRTTIDN